MSNWISVETEIPKGNVLVCYLQSFFGCFTQEVAVGYYDDPDDYEDGIGRGWLFWITDVEINSVTHWMPLPEPPNTNT